MATIIIQNWLYFGKYGVYQSFKEATGMLFHISGAAWVLQVSESYISSWETWTPDDFYMLERQHGKWGLQFICLYLKYLQKCERFTFVIHCIFISYYNTYVHTHTHTHTHTHIHIYIYIYIYIYICMYFCHWSGRPGFSPRLCHT